MATQASKQAHEEAKKHAPSNETRILTLIQGLEHHGATKKEIELALGMKHQTVTSRLSSLRDQGKIYLNHNDGPKDGCTIWYATPSEQVKQKAKERQHAKYVKWLRQGADNYGITSNTINKINMDYQNTTFIEWKGSDDDQTASISGYTLRVEQLGIRDWWWNVSFEGETIQSSNFHNGINSENLSQAQNNCVAVMDNHKRQN